MVKRNKGEFGPRGRALLIERVPAPLQRAGLGGRKEEESSQSRPRGHPKAELVPPPCQCLSHVWVPSGYLQPVPLDCPLLEGRAGAQSLARHLPEGCSGKGGAGTTP